jgi:hypothetical protein
MARRRRSPGSSQLKVPVPPPPRRTGPSDPAAKAPATVKDTGKPARPATVRDRAKHLMLDGIAVPWSVRSCPGPALASRG